MNERHTFLVLVVHAGVSVIVIVAATVLTALGDLPASATTAIFGAAIGLVGGIQAAASGISRNGNGGHDRKPPLELH